MTTLTARCKDHPDFYFALRGTCPACSAIAGTDVPKPTPPRAIAYRGTIGTIADWARLFGMKPNALRERIRVRGSARKALDELMERK